MRSKYSAIKHVCTLLVFLFFLFCPVKLSAAGLLSKPRKMYIVKTQHFEIIYSKESEETAAILAGAVESLYEKASLELKVDKNLFIPVVISPDSDILSVEFTPSPYDRIIIFDSPADYDTSNYNDSLLDLFYREIYSALIQKTRSPVNEFLARYLAGENYQPASIWNLPFSFVDGAAYLEEGKNGLGRINDGYFLQILSQAKLEGKFPRWMQIATVVDTPPGEKVVLAAGTAFSAFLISHYGIEQYERLWKESGKINPFSIHQVFFRVYKKTLSKLWKEFEKSVPLPDELYEVYRLEDCSKKVFEKYKQADFAHVLFTEYGIVWYDKIRHEVDIYNQNAKFKKRSKLFLADAVDKMSLSQDGRYISISYKRCEKKDGLYACLTSIYDLAEKKVVQGVLPLREASFVVCSNGDVALCGVNVTDSKPRLQVYDIQKMKTDKKSHLIFEKEFSRYEVPFSPVYAGNGFICCIVSKNAKQELLRIPFDNPDEKISEEKYQIDFFGGQVQLRNLVFNKNEDQAFYTFEFGITDSQYIAFTRAGIIYLDDSYRPEKVSYMKNDVSGGTCEPQINNGELCYISRKYEHNELRRVALSELIMEEGSVISLVQENQNSINQPSHTTPSVTAAGNPAFENPKRYNPLKYLIHLSFKPGLPIKYIDFNEGIFYWPGLGMSVVTQEDPLLNNTIMLSAGWNYLPLDFSWTINLPSQYLKKVRHESTKIDKDKSAAIFIENSSTPVTLKAAACFNYNLDGGYDLKVQAGSSWFVPIGIALKNLTFDVYWDYQLSTDYFDEELAAKYPEKYPSLSNWPYCKNAYELWEFSVSMEYSNIHQYGPSRFENKGLRIGARYYSILEADVINFNLGVYGTLAIPRLTPFNTWHGWIFSAPASVTVDFINRNGRAFESTEEILIIGKEIHRGITPLYTYFRRVGLKASHSFNMRYDYEPGRRPDLRDMNYVYNVFSNVYCTNIFSLILDIDINVPAGKLSSVPISSYIKASYCPEEQYFKFGFDFRLNF